MERGVCIGCGRKMYKVPPSIGTASEWRHDSSGHAISWSPERHIAGSRTTFEHQHKWGPTDVQRTRVCEVADCDANIIEMSWSPAAPLTERERKQQASRLRGSSARGNRPPREVPTSNAS